MNFIAILFWICLFIIFYNYVGYGLLLTILVWIKKSRVRRTLPPPVSDPEITLIIAAYNEGDYIDKKIRNCLELNYPRDKLHILFITDGSTDDSPEKISRYEGIQLMHQSPRQGKTAALNRAMREVKSPIVIFCDANTLLNKDAIRLIARHYADEKVGGVAGEKRIATHAGSSIAGVGEGFYWKYESRLKKLDSDFYSVVGAAGELFSVRTALYDEVEPDVILDDFIISLRVAMKGYRVVYEPDAYAIEAPSASMADEQKRKIRISAGGIQSVVRLRKLLNIFRYPRLSFQYISHRVLRWTLTPLCLVAVLILNIILWRQRLHFIYTLLLAGQLLFYAFALLGYALTKNNKRFTPLYVPYYFLFMNLSVYLGFVRYLKKQQSAIWEKVSREDPA